MAQTFSKAERLSGIRNFEDLVKNGQSFFVHPFRIMWMRAGPNQESPLRIAFGVPKRNFKSAVKRNRIKRLMREAYRLNKHELYPALEQKSVKIVVMIVYTQRDMPDFNKVKGKIILSLLRLLDAIDGAGKHG